MQCNAVARPEVVVDRIEHDEIVALTAEEHWLLNLVLNGMGELKGGRHAL